MNIPSDQIAELQLLAARAEASVDASMAAVRYASTRRLATAIEKAGGPTTESYDSFSTPFNMFALSIDGRDIMFCRTPEIAKFIVALLNFGGAIVAECSKKDTRAAIEKELSLMELIAGVDRNEAWPDQRKP